MRLWVLVVALLAGCSDPIYFDGPDPARDEEAAQAAWLAYSDTFPTATTAHPAVIWVEGQRAQGIDGQYDPATDTVSLTWEGNYHRSALAHEFFHVLLWRAYRNGDADHLGLGWKVLVPKVEEGLRKAGL